MFYKIIKNIHPIPLKFRDKFSNENRASQYYTSRLALQQCLEETYPHKDIQFPEGLEIFNHHYLTKIPDICVSLSHNKICSAAAIGSRKEYTSIGIDIEKSDRKFHPRLKKFFVNQHDYLDKSQSLLELWCIKEAAFKALYPISRQFWPKTPLLLKDIFVKNHYFGIAETANIVGEIHLSYELFEGEEFIVSRAHISPEKK